MLFHAFLYFERRYISSYEKLVSLVRIKERNPVLQGSPKETKALTARRKQAEAENEKEDFHFLRLCPFP